MLAEKYKVTYGADFSVFEFVCEGPKGQIHKLVQYSETNLKNFFNLGFGDKNDLTQEIDDLVISNNNDSQKVLATVSATLYVFTEHYPDAYVLATGSTEARTRLYRMGITNNLEAIEADFLIYGLADGNWHAFKKNVIYEAFLIKGKG